MNGTNITTLPNELKQSNSDEDWIRDRKIALDRTIKSHNYNKKIYDKHRKHFDFNVGNMVFVENGNKLNREKLDELKIGPYEITEKISNSIYRINMNRRK